MKARIALLGALLLSGCQITGPETGEMTLNIHGGS